MLPYYEFYSDMDLLLKQIEEMIDKCNEWWFGDEPFKNADGNEESCEKWADLRDKLEEIHDILNDEPFYKYEENDI